MVQPRSKTQLLPHPFVACRNGHHLHHHPWYVPSISSLRNPHSASTDLSDDAHILYSSDSIVDILGHTPDEVVNRSVWQFFHPDELPLAKAQHSRGVRLDKAAVLSYCRLKNRQGEWVGCECCFSVVYDVLVCCTSVYRQGMQSQSKLLTPFVTPCMLTRTNQSVQLRRP